MTAINEQNWNYSSYISKQLMAFISLMAAPAENSQQVDITFCVTVTDHDFQEVFQKSFSDLSLALEYLTAQYGHWEFSSSRGKKSDSGCGTCSAH